MLEGAMCRCQTNVLFILAQKMMAWDFLLLQQQGQGWILYVLWKKTFDKWRKSKEEKSVSSWMMSLHNRRRVRVVGCHGKQRERGE